MAKKAVTRFLLLIFFAFFIWDQPSRTWWVRHFKSGSL